MTFLKFPDNFQWGTATSAYQIEGAWDTDGKGPSIWDHFAHQTGNIAKGHTGDTAANHYEHMPADVQLIKELGYPTYSFSISWPRVIPQGQGAPNPKGLDFYNRLVDELLEAGITPNATLNHWDFPQALYERGGWLSRDSIDWFAEYAHLMFETLGDRVPYWVTHNEPWVISVLGYGHGIFAPGISDYPKTYQVLHHLLVSHGKAVEAFRQGSYPGEIGIVFNFDKFMPASDDPDDVAAYERAYAENVSLFLEPVFKGHYPQILMDWLNPNQPKIEDGDFDYIQEPIDFLGINYYKAFSVVHDPTDKMLNARWDPLSAPGWGYTQLGWGIFPEGLTEMLLTVKEATKDIPLYITENGTPFPDTPDEEGRVRDDGRIEFIREHLRCAHAAIEAGVNLRGYLAWSLMDNFEWASGYDPRFGLVYVDFDTQERIPKDSARWYSQVIAENGIHI